MAGETNQKLKMLYLAKILSEFTDEEHGLSASEIIKKLNQLDIRESRKTVYSDIEELRRFGMDIISVQDGKNVIYKYVSPVFELPELKLLVDAVQCSTFITEKKSRRLIAKLETLTSSYNRNQLNRQVVLSGRIKNMNESIYYSVDMLYAGINSDVQIEFHYFSWNAKKEMVLKHEGSKLRVSPWALIWNDGFYYLLAYDSAAGMMKRYRVDKILHISLTDISREGEEQFENIDIARYSRKLFSMFEGTERVVTLQCDNEIANVIIDRFGKDVHIIPSDEKSFTVNVKVSVSGQFLGWIIGVGPKVRIIGPQAVVNEMKSILRQLSEEYEI